MTNKMKYGPKFNGGQVVGGIPKYDKECDPKTWGGAFNPSLFKKSPLKVALTAGKTHSNNKAARARVGKLPNGDPPAPKVKSRGDYEKEFGAVIAEVVTRLEHGLEELNMAPPLKTKEAPLINRRQVIEAISRLKQSFYRPGQSGVMKGTVIGPRRGKYT